MQTKGNELVVAVILAGAAQSELELNGNIDEIRKKEEKMKDIFFPPLKQGAISNLN